MRSHAQLSRYPKDLYTLWNEYEFGLGGQKAAKDFMGQERGANKFTYSKRKVFWDGVTKLIQRGYSSDTAIDKVYSVYGMANSVSTILKAMREDRMNKVEKLL